MPPHSSRRLLRGVPRPPPGPTSAPFQKRFELDCTATSLLRSSIHVLEVYYGDGDPIWVEGKGKRACDTAADAEKAWRRDIRHLRLRGKTSDYPDAIADHIASCHIDGRCGSGACALCRRAFQRWFVDQAHRFFESRVTSSALAAFCIILPIHIRGGDDHEHLKRLLRGVLRQLHDACASVGLSTVIGGVDISRNHHNAKAHRPFFQLHFWGFAPFAEAQRARSTLKALFPSSSETSRPVWIDPKTFDGNLAGYAYGMKTTFTRRQTVPAGVDADGKVRRQNTRNGKSLTVAENQLLLPILHILGLRGRLILHGSELKSDVDGYAIIV